VPTSFAGTPKNAEAFINGLGLTKADLLGFSVAGMANRAKLASDHFRASDYPSFRIEICIARPSNVEAKAASADARGNR
jgi:hypothetical protein